MMAMGTYVASLPPWLTVCILYALGSAIAYYAGTQRGMKRGISAGYADCRDWHQRAMGLMLQREQTQAIEQWLDALFATKDQP